MTAHAKSRARQGGFTLVELMVALLIFGLLAGGGVALLGFSVRAQAAGGARLDDIEALNRTMSAMSADLAQAVVRPTRDENGTTFPAFTGEGSSSATPMLRLVRAGWGNLDAAPRPGLQKVEYRVEGGVLQRIAYPQLDGAAPLAAAAMLTHVRSASLRYRYLGAWSGRWDGAGGVPLPGALELVVVRENGIAVRLMFLVGTGYAPPPVGATDAAS